MLLHFQLQELKTEGLSGSVLIALQWYLDSSGCWSCLIQWHFQILRIYLHDFVTYHNHSSLLSAGTVQHLGPWGAEAQGQPCTAAQAVRRDEGRAWADAGMRWVTQQPLLAEFKRPGWEPLPLGYHTYTAFLIPLHARCERLPLPRDPWQPLFGLCWWPGAFSAG